MVVVVASPRWGPPEGARTERVTPARSRLPRRRWGRDVWTRQDASHLYKLYGDCGFADTSSSDNHQFVGLVESAASSVVVIFRHDYGVRRSEPRHEHVHTSEDRLRHPQRYHRSHRLTRAVTPPANTPHRSGRHPQSHSRTGTSVTAAAPADSGRGGLVETVRGRGGRTVSRARSRRQTGPTID